MDSFWYCGQSLCDAGLGYEEGNPAHDSGDFSKAEKLLQAPKERCLPWTCPEAEHAKR